MTRLEQALNSALGKLYTLTPEEKIIFTGKKLKEISFNSIYLQGYMGVILRINNDTEELNPEWDFIKTVKFLNEHPDTKKISEAIVLNERDYFDVKVLVLDYSQEGKNVNNA